MVSTFADLPSGWIYLRVSSIYPMMRFQVVLEEDPETGHVIATVAEFPNVFVDGRSEEEALQMAKEAIALALEDEQGSTGRTPRRPSRIRARVVTVDV